MPFIHGVCVPGICYDIIWGFANAVLMQYTIRGGTQIDRRNVTNNFPDVFKQGKDRLTAAAKQGCDGCVCMRIVPPAIPPGLSFIIESRSETDAAGIVTTFEYRLEGYTATFRSFGICVPPGSKVKVKKAGKDVWIPVEEMGAPPSTPSSGGKKKTGKKKRRKTKTVSRKTRRR
jgi:hypothetical protein